MFKNTYFNDLLAEIQKESKNENKCLISRLDLYAYNSITLPCNHSYRVDYFSKIIRKHSPKCPYCSISFTPVLLQKNCSYLTKKNTVCGKTTYCNSGLCKVHGSIMFAPKCTHILKNGKICTKIQFENEKCKTHCI